MAGGAVSRAGVRNLRHSFAVSRLTDAYAARGGCVTPVRSEMAASDDILPAAPPTQHAEGPGSASSGARFAALRSRNFATLWAGLIVSNAGAQMQNVAKAWLILQRTDSPLSLGLLSFCFAVPMTLLPPVGGALADRVDRVWLVKRTQTLMVLEPLLLALLLATGHAPLWLLYVDTAFAATVLAFDSPARQSLVPALVPREDLLSATSLNAVVFTGAALVGPALGGLLLRPLGAAWIFALNGLTTLAVLAALLRLRGVSGREGAGGRRVGLADGARYVWTRRPVLAILGISASISLLAGSYQTLLPVLARDHWHVGASGYGLLASAPGAGALIGAFGLAALGNLRRKELIAIGAPLVVAAALLVVARVPPYAAGLGLLVLVGVAGSAGGAVIATLLQFASPGELRGRIMALNTVCVIGLSSFGGLLAGALAQVWGAPAAIALAAAAVLLSVPLLARIAIHA